MSDDNTVAKIEPAQLESPPKRANLGRKTKKSRKGRGGVLKTANDGKASVAQTTAENASMSVGRPATNKNKKTSIPMESRDPNAVSSALSWLGKRDKVVLLRDADGKPVAGLVTYKWLKRRLSRKKLQNLREATDATVVKNAKKNRASGKKEKKTKGAK